MSGINSGFKPLTNFTDSSKIEKTQTPPNNADRKTGSKIEPWPKPTVCPPFNNEKNEIKQFKSMELKEFKMELQGNSHSNKNESSIQKNGKDGESLSTLKENHKMNEKEQKLFEKINPNKSDKIISPEFHGDPKIQLHTKEEKLLQKLDSSNLKHTDKTESKSQSLSESLKENFDPSDLKKDKIKSHTENNIKSELKVEMMNTDPAFIQFAEKIKHK